jgi:hypothetical protein
MPKDIVFDRESQLHMVWRVWGGFDCERDKMMTEATFFIRVASVSIHKTMRSERGRKMEYRLSSAFEVRRGIGSEAENQRSSTDADP